MGRPIKKTFYDWCIENNHLDYLERWNYELNQCSPNDIGSKSNKFFNFKCFTDSTHRNILAKPSELTKHKQGLIYCIDCNSFYKWCVNNNRYDLLNRWDYSLNKINPEDVLAGSNLKFWFKCPNLLHASEQIMLNNITYKLHAECKCSKCNSFAQLLINIYGNNALLDYWDYDKNTLNPWNISRAENIKVWIKCNEVGYHESYEIKCNDFYTGSRCPYCAHKQVHKYDSVGYLYPEVFDSWSDKNTCSPYEITQHSHKSIVFYCNKHGEYEGKLINRARCDFKCPMCSFKASESHLQEYVRIYLESILKYSTNHEEKCSISPKNPYTNWRLKYDNEVIDLKLIIEVHGIQHYEVGYFHTLQAKNKNTTPEQEFEYGLWKDRYKKEYALSLGYYYLEIPYWTEKDESYKTLIDNKINRILSESQQDSLLLCSNE